jgi:hypothetical protein
MRPFLMNAPEKLNQMFRAPKLTRTRMILAFTVAVIADGLQFIFTPVPFVDQAIDVVAFALTAWAIGFHVLLLPTFAVEFIPGVDMLPTWTACVIAVIALRKRNQNTVTAPPPDSPAKSVKPPVDV